MAETKVAAVQTQLNGIMDTIDVKILRPRMKEAFLCSANCCDQPGSQHDLENCKNKCGGAMQQVQNVLQQELGGFQNKLQGCMRRCQEAAQEGLYTSGTSNPSQRDVDRATKQMESCMGQCADQFKGVLPAMEKRILSQFQ